VTESGSGIPEEVPPPLDRRHFLGQAALLAGISLAIDGRRFVSAASPAIDSVTSSDSGDTTSGSLPSLAAEKHMRVIDLEVDVMVAGGGMAGVCAAVASARNGATTLLVQDRSRLGGNASSEIGMHIVGADVHGNRSGWREGGLIEEIRLEDARRNPHRAFELFDLTLYDLCQREELLTLKLDTSVYSAEVLDGKITRVLARCDKTETIYRVQAGVYCDCTGDCRLGLEAGAEFRTGREPRAQYNESLALEKGDKNSQGSTILFTATKHENPIDFIAPPWARKMTENDFLFRKIPRGSYEYGYWWIELGGDRDVIHDNEELRFDLLRIVLGIWDWIKNSGERPDSANWALQRVGMIPGKRESRRLTGAHIQTQDDLTDGWKKRDDGVSIGGWPFDEHPPGGFDDWDQPPAYSKPIKEPYNIAFEALYSTNIDNLMMAGRNISNSHVAFTSTRVMATCACTGQAIGTAAALCASKKIPPPELRKHHIGELQQRLLRDDQSIRAIGNQDRLDLARTAKISASSHLAGADPIHVIDGEVRDTPGQWSHRWGAEMADGGQWIELSWDEPVTISEIQITFDTGFHRQLTLSASDSASRNIIRGPQPETVSDYTLSITDSDGTRSEIANVEGNYQRLRRHHFEASSIRSLRLHVNATHGSPHIRVFEIRCY
jgi:hypothetical protein